MWKNIFMFPHLVLFLWYVFKQNPTDFHKQLCLFTEIILPHSIGYYIVLQWFYRLSTKFFFFHFSLFLYSPLWYVFKQSSIDFHKLLCLFTEIIPLYSIGYCIIHQRYYKLSNKNFFLYFSLFLYSPLKEDSLSIALSIFFYLSIFSCSCPSSLLSLFPYFFLSDLISSPLAFFFVVKCFPPKMSVWNATP